VIIDPACDLKTATKRILWGKVVNAGQTCVAPDYVLVPRDFQDKFVGALKETCVLFLYFLFCLLAPLRIRLLSCATFAFESVSVEGTFYALAFPPCVWLGRIAMLI
jgi:hypothetical protein